MEKEDYTILFVKDLQYSGIWNETYSQLLASSIEGYGLYRNNYDSNPRRIIAVPVFEIVQNVWYFKHLFRHISYDEPSLFETLSRCDPQDVFVVYKQSDCGWAKRRIAHGTQFFVQSVYSSPLDYSAHHYQKWS